MQKKLLRTSLFGFSKTEVCDYIARVNDEFNGKIDLITAEHTKERNELTAQIAALNEEINKYKQANADIAQALFDAQQYATELKAKADGEYKEAQDELLALKEAETDKLNTYREKIENVRKEIVSVLSDIDDKLAAETVKTEDLIAEYNSEEGIAV
ncbi:MAG: DivIVA domain-containing protein [Clostridia bacterium]|jgi:cell division septum initiation protein DivIVA|nr:DivIVA domain-containing protein [Clostridia bacterium]